MSVETASATVVGSKRASNQDCVGELEAAGLLVLADGMDELPGGDVASRLAVQCVHDVINGDLRRYRRGHVDLEVASSNLVRAFRTANESVRAKHQERAFRGMATTLLAAQFVARHVVIAHVGDSRCYLFRSGMLLPLTRDHLAVVERLSDGAHEPIRHVLARAIGKTTDVKVDVAIERVEHDDALVLCSNGLVDAVSPVVIRRVLLEHADPTTACEALIAAARAADAADDVTAIVARVRIASDPWDGVT